MTSFLQPEHPEETEFSQRVVQTLHSRFELPNLVYVSQRVRQIVDQGYVYHSTGRFLVVVGLKDFLDTRADILQLLFYLLLPVVDHNSVIQQPLFIVELFYDPFASCFDVRSFVDDITARK